MGSYQEVKGHLLKSIRISLGMGRVIKVYKAEPIKCPRAVKTLV